MKKAIMAVAIGVVLGATGPAAHAQPAAETVTVASSPGQAKAVRLKEAVATVEAIDAKRAT